MLYVVPMYLLPVAQVIDHLVSVVRFDQLTRPADESFFLLLLPFRPWILQVL